MANIAIDHVAIANRIIAILKANSTLYDESKPGKDKLRKIQFVGNTYDMDDDTLPFGYVQVADRFEKTNEQVGTGLATSGQRILNYNIVVVDWRKDSESVQTKLLGFIEQVRQSLANNPTLKDPVANNDPKVARMVIGDTTTKTTKKNAEKMGMMMSIQCVIGSFYSVTLNGSLTIPLLSKPRDQTLMEHDVDLMDTGKDVVTPVSDSNVLMLEVENSPSIKTSVKSLIDAENEISLVVDNPSGNETYNVMLLEYTTTAPFDNIDRAVLTARIVEA